MTEPDDDLDYDDPEVEQRWCAEQRADVEHHLARQPGAHGRIGDWPAWHVAPVVAIWAVESLAKPGWVGWWAISGDLPTDHVSVGPLRHPREALHAFADRWERHCEAVRAGAGASEDMSIGGASTPLELVPLLESRARLLRKFAEDDEIW